MLSLLGFVPLHNGFAAWFGVLRDLAWEACCLTGESDWLVTRPAVWCGRELCAVRMGS